MQTILLIEDNDDLRSNTAEILELANYHVKQACDGEAAVEILTTFTPDLIICDIKMPGLDGYQVLTKTREMQQLQCVPFIFLSALSERQDLRRGMELGADDYVTKPFTGTELLSAVEGRLKYQSRHSEETIQPKKAKAPLVESCPFENAWHSMIANRSVNSYNKKQLIYSAGNYPNAIYFILKGKVKTFRVNKDGKELVTNLFHEGEYIGYVSPLEGTVYNDTAQALEPTELLVIPREEFEQLLYGDTVVSHQFIHLLAANVSEKQQQLLGIAYNSLRQKVAVAILMLANAFNKLNGQGPIFNLSRDNLATIAGTASESLIRTLTDFKNENLIEITSNNIIVINREKLEQVLN